MVLIFIAFLLVACAQPDWSIFCCIAASSCGYALFWKGLLAFESKKKRFLLALLWFAAIEAIHLSWFTADRYVGSPIYLVLILLTLTLGVCFALFSLIVKKNLSLLSLCALSSLWTLSEWARLFFLSGFSFDPIGLSLSATLYGMQGAALGGIFALTFWVVLTNLIGLKTLLERKKHLFSLWLVVAFAPYLYGITHLAFHERERGKQGEAPLSALLVQTALYPEEKMRFPFSHAPPLSPVEQWKRILHLLKEHEGKKIDLIVLSEAVVPYGTTIPLYTPHVFAEAWKEVFPLRRALSGKGGNEVFAQALADFFEADVVIGLEDSDAFHAYNAAFHFRPQAKERARYEKRVLVPMGEYIPFAWCKKILSSYGIEDSFEAGREAKVFQGKRLPFGVSICYEETYGHLMRENLKKGAKVLINLTNDAWYPHSRLPLVHYLHGRLRAVEGGVPLLRATNTGVTIAVDSLGREWGALPYESAQGKAIASALHVSLPSYTYRTPYALFGDWGIVMVSLGFILLNKNRKKDKIR